MPHPPLLSELTEDQRALALERFQILQPHLEEGVPLIRLAEQHGLFYRTLQRWLARYRQYGLVGLARPKRRDRGKLRQVHPELQHLIEGLALQTPPPSTAAIYRRIQPIAHQQGWLLPSYRTVTSLVRKLNPALQLLAHQGTKAYQASFDLLYRREATAPNEIWQADHTLLDIWLLHERGLPARPWLTVILDDYSRAVAGYYLTFQPPSAIQTALALRQAIWRKTESQWHVCGIPAVFYSDHASDFTSRHLEQVSADLKMQLVFSTPGQPRGRGRIERFFQTVNQLFLCELPGFAPEGAPPATPALTLAAFEPLLRAFLLETYHQRTHSETHQTPQDRWEAGGFLPQLPESVDQLDLLLLTVAKPRRVQRDGIRFQGFRYLDVTLAVYVGEDVTIRYDPRDMAQIRVYQHDAFICRAVCQELAGQTISLKEIIQARSQRRKQLRQHIQHRNEVIDLLIEAHREAQPPEPPPPDGPPKKPPLKRYAND
jgi:putative transposase